MISDGSGQIAGLINDPAQSGVGVNPAAVRPSDSKVKLDWRDAHQGQIAGPNRALCRLEPERSRIGQQAGNIAIAQGVVAGQIGRPAYRGKRCSQQADAIKAVLRIAAMQAKGPAHQVQRRLRQGLPAHWTGDG
jgi:hypothetical protein